jgi:hypothetical protein
MSDIACKQMDTYCLPRGQTVGIRYWPKPEDIPLDTTGSVRMQIVRRNGEVLLSKTVPLFFDADGNPYWITEISHEESLSLPVGHHEWGFSVFQSVDPYAAVKIFKGGFHVTESPSEVQHGQ